LSKTKEKNWQIVKNILLIIWLWSF
jgi:hypothetical protein